MSESPYVAPTAIVEDGAIVGDGTFVWDLAAVRRDARVGAGCTIGRGAFIDVGVVLGDNCKVQNDALVYQPARIAAGVFIGPSAVLTNDRFPRAINPDGSRKLTDDWEAVGVVVEHGASVGAAATVLGGVTIGRWSLVAAGSTVTRDVPAFALVAGSPARRIAWVGPAGRPLSQVDGDLWECPVTTARFQELDGRLEER